MRDAFTAFMRRDLKAEIEARVGHLVGWHINPAPPRPVDRPDRSLATDVPASILYHLVCALTQYLDSTARKSR
ncbi:hypothetical protein NKI91_19795 [Mesorhizobium sp. M0312]|uniref:hypothetical protein n=1 Tax=Mesorhizobium sp. M0312 TaxID=2956934 RepID=UPI003336938E